MNVKGLEVPASRLAHKVRSVQWIRRARQHVGEWYTFDQGRPVFYPLYKATNTVIVRFTDGATLYKRLEEDVRS